MTHETIESLVNTLRIEADELDREHSAAAGELAREAADKLEATALQLDARRAEAALLHEKMRDAINAQVAAESQLDAVQSELRGMTGLCERYMDEAKMLASRLDASENALDDLWNIVTTAADSLYVRIMKATDRLRATKYEGRSLHMEDGSCEPSPECPDGEHDFAATIIHTINAGKMRCCVKCWRGYPVESASDRLEDVEKPLGASKGDTDRREPSRVGQRIPQGDWPEDAGRDDVGGEECLNCGGIFIGAEGRNQCKECATVAVAPLTVVDMEQDGDELLVHLSDGRCAVKKLPGLTENEARVPDRHAQSECEFDPDHLYHDHDSERQNHDQ